jgi:hypothetical protein
MRREYTAPKKIPVYEVLLTPVPYEIPPLFH